MSLINASVIAETDQGGQIDTVYMAADRMVYHTVPKCDIDGNIIMMAGKRLEDMSVDAVASYRAKNSEDSGNSGDSGDAQSPIGGRPQAGSAADAPVDSLKIDKDSLPPMDDLQQPADTLDSLAVIEVEPLDSVALAEKLRLDSIAQREKFVLDSIAMADSLAAERARFVADSLANRDTTAIGFLTATGHIRMFKSDMQARCDSLEYTDLDSLARLFISPIIWNEGNRQYTSDSLTVSIKNQRMDKASLMSNAFIIIQEDTICFDQIKGAEILAYFDSTTALERFDALGGSQALFYLKENDAFATVNKVEAKMITANFVDGEIDRIYYFDNPKNDAYPVVQLPPEEKQMKGFNWQPELRPRDKSDITPLELRRSERTKYLAHSLPQFTQTENFFPGHMRAIAKKLAAADSLRQVRHAEERRRQALAEQQAELEAVQDSLAASAAADSLASVTTVPEPEEDIVPARDSVSVSGELPERVEEPVRELTPEEQKAAEAAEKAAEKAARKAEAEAKRQARVDAREARWARLDARDAAKEAAKEAKALEKKRKRTLEAVLSAQKEAARDQKKLDRYIRRYEKQKERRENRKQNK